MYSNHSHAHSIYNVTDSDDEDPFMDLDDFGTEVEEDETVIDDE